MDLVKIQYENTFPRREDIRSPADWAKMPVYGMDFYEDQLGIIAGLVEATGREALVLATIYTPFMCAGHTVGGAVLNEHIREDPEAVNKGMDAITESLIGFVKASIAAGVDGFLAPTQGRESHRFTDADLFDTCIRPYDLALMEEMRDCEFSILHICDFHGGYDDLRPFVAYPGDVVNCSQEVDGRALSPTEVSELFSRPYMGGVDRKGIIATGTDAEIEQMVDALLAEAPPRFILGADCTLPGDIDWNNIRKAIDVAHGVKG
jgi:uroporphyrinogen decarboxylase